MESLTELSIYDFVDFQNLRTQCVPQVGHHRKDLVHCKGLNVFADLLTHDFNQFRVLVCPEEHQ
jgi:hypothetical protein